MNFKEQESKQKLRGGYYTPSTIAFELASWAVQHEPKSILEPSCGDGVFFRELLKLIHEGEKIKGVSIDGVELIGDEAKLANQYSSDFERCNNRLSIVEGDFLSWIDSQPENKVWDAIIGNPPYIRYQYFDSEQSAAASRIFAKCGLKFSKLTNAWVTFLIASILHLSPSGRLAMVVPEEIIHILHAEGLRRYLEVEMQFIRLIDVREMVFGHVLQGVMLLICIKKPAIWNSKSKKNSLNEELSTRIEIVPLRDINALRDAIQGDYTHSFAGKRLNGKWTHGLLTPSEDELLNRLISHNGLYKFSTLANVDIGIVTGANDYFVVDTETVRQYNFADIAMPMLARSNFINGIIYTENDHWKNAEAGKPVFFLEFPPKAKADLPIKWQEYINLGEAQRLHRRYKCRIRSPWYVVPYVWISQISLLKRSHDYPRFVLNENGAYSTDTAYRVTMLDLYRGRERDFVFSFLNSITLLTTELEGRHYGGGVLELVPSEIEKLLIPLVTPTEEQFNHLDDLVRRGISIDEILDFSDPIIIGPGTPTNMSLDEIHILRAAKNRLRNRRYRI